MAARPGSPARQERRLDELEALFLAKGFAPLTVEDLARTLRCSKATLYALAPSKEQLVTRVVDRYFRRVGPRLEARVARAGGHQLDRVSAYLSGIADELRLAREPFFRDIADFPPARAAYERNSLYAADRIRQMIAEGIAAGAFLDLHTGFVAEIIAQTITGIQNGDLLRRTGLTAAEAYDELTGFVLRALMPGTVAAPRRRRDRSRGDAATPAPTGPAVTRQPA